MTSVDQSFEASVRKLQFLLVNLLGPSVVPEDKTIRLGQGYKTLSLAEKRKEESKVARSGRRHEL